MVQKPCQASPAIQQLEWVLVLDNGPLRRPFCWHPCLTTGIAVLFLQELAPTCICTLLFTKYISHKLSVSEAAPLLVGSANAQVLTAFVQQMQSRNTSNTLLFFNSFRLLFKCYPILKRKITFIRVFTSSRFWTRFSSLSRKPKFNAQKQTDQPIGTASVCKPR